MIVSNHNILNLDAIIYLNRNNLKTSMVIVKFEVSDKR